MRLRRFGASTSRIDPVRKSPRNGACRTENARIMDDSDLPSSAILVRVQTPVSTSRARRELDWAVCEDARHRSSAAGRRKRGRDRGGTGLGQSRL